MSDLVYRADLPWNTSPETIEALRGLGSVHLTFEVSGPNRSDVIADLAEEYEWRGLSESWWSKNLSKRGRHAD